MAQKTGIYYVIFHISLTQNANSSLVTAATIINDNIKNISFQASSDTGSHFTASGFLSLQVQDEISILIKANTQYTIEKTSYLGVQFQGNVLIETGFLLSLDSDHVLTKRKEMVYRWKPISYGQFSTLKIFHYGQQTYQLPSTGVYLFSLNLIFKAHKKPLNISVNLLTNDDLLLTTNHALDSDSTLTLNMHDIVHLKSNTIIKVSVTSQDMPSEIHLLHSSTFSMMLIKNEHSKGDGFHASLSESHSFTSTTEGIYTTPWEACTDKKGHYKWMTGSDFSDKTFFSNIQASQVFYVSSHVVFSVVLRHPKIEYDDHFKITFAFQKDEQSIFIEKTIHPVKLMAARNQTVNETMAVNITIGNKTISQSAIQPSVIRFNETIYLNGIYELNQLSPIGIFVKSNYKAIVTIHESSTFSAMQTIPDYPGAHGSLQGFKIIDSDQPYIAKGWNTDPQTFLGLYDFSESLDQKRGYYKVKEDGIYYSWANLVTVDIDSTIRLTATLSTLDGHQVIRYKNSNPSQTTTINLGGIFNLREGDFLYFEIRALGDESWTIKTGGFSVTYISPKPMYFQAIASNDQLVDNIPEDKNKVKFPFSNYLLEHVFVIPRTGVYLMTANIILNKDNALKVGQTTYEIFITLNNVRVEGIYSKKKTRSVTIENYMTLFFSSSFYTIKGMKVALNVLSDVEHKFKISEGSSWSVAFIAPQSETSGALGTLNQVAVFQSKSSPTVGDWLYTHIKPGHFESRHGLQFNQKHITVLEEGLYAVALNLDVSYRIRDESTIIKVIIVVNQDDVNQDVQNGLATWYTSSYPTQTLHVCGTIFLHAGDKVSIQIMSQHLEKLVVNKPSSLSMVMIPEYVKSYSVAAYLTVSHSF